MPRDNLLTTVLQRALRQQAGKIESDSLEFKGLPNQKAIIENLETIARELVAFANTSGGALIIGVADKPDKSGSWNSQLTGVALEGFDIVGFEERLRSCIRPSHLKLTMRVEQFEGKDFFIIQTPKSSNSLVSTAKGGYYVRRGRSSVPMEPGDVKNAIGELATFDWSSEVLDLHSLDSLDERALRSAHSRFLQVRKHTATTGTVSFLEAINATSNGRLTRAGLLFLGKQRLIRKHLGLFEYRFTWRTGDEKSLVNEVWDDCIWNSIERVSGYFAKCNQEITITINDKVRSVTLLDELAFREAFINAVVHRDYTEDGMVTVNFQNRHITIANPGAFYGGVNPSNIVKHEPRHRNKGLAANLMSTYLVDRAGYGVKRMGLCALRYGRKLPTFEESHGSVRVRMEAQSFRKGIMAIVEKSPQELQLADLVVLNSVYERGFIPIAEAMSLLEVCSDDPWTTLIESLEKLPQLLLAGSNDGLFVAVAPEAAKLLEVGAPYRTGKLSCSHVAIFRFLKKYGDATSKDIANAIGVNTAAAAKMLSNALYCRKIGVGSKVRWSLS